MAPRLAPADALRFACSRSNSFFCLTVGFPLRGLDSPLPCRCPRPSFLIREWAEGSPCP